ncbi:MAG: CmcJ/NvfI family oxidoreductase [Pseudomonadota bacterium]
MTTTQQANTTVNAVAFVEAELNYLKPQAAKPVNYAITPPPGVPQRGGQADPRRVRIFDARSASTAPTLDRNGFQVHSHESQLSDFSDEAALRSIYYPEAEAVIRELTGAAKVVIFDHTRRYALPGHVEPGIRETASRVHNDQTFTAATRRVRDHLPAEEAEARLKKRHAIINFWRPTSYPVQTWPLALCDASSIDPSDLVATDLVYADKVGETYSFVHNPKHRWFYYPRLTPDEVILLKIYDSRTDGTARLTAHTAFDDPSSPPDALHRRSIELRTLVFWNS